MSRVNQTKEKPYMDVAVIGAGASGLTAAIAAARAGAVVCVLNHHSVPGKKILSTGNGKCNFTNAVQDMSCYRSDDPGLVRRVLAQFTWEDAIAFFEGIGVYAKPRNGYYYPLSGQAVTVRDALLAEANRLNVEIRNDIDITDLTAKDGAFLIRMRTGDFSARKCILAAGGAAAAKTGSDGSGYALAAALGHGIKTPLPALVPLTSRERWLRRIAGVRCEGCVTLLVDGHTEASDTGELQFLDTGISGIPVFQVSRFASIALAEGRGVRADLDFFPDTGREELGCLLSDLAGRFGAYKNWQQILGGLCNQKIAAMLCDKLQLASCPVNEFPEGTIDGQADAIADNLKKTTVSITGTASFDHAQTTCGGIPLSEIGPDLQSLIVPGLYFAGEILNVDGICGGYNLQWAWSSGYLAGTHAAE